MPAIDHPHLELAYQATALLDWGQTRYIATDPTREEVNPILGPTPSLGDVNSYFVLAGMAHAGVSLVLPAKYEKYWQYVSIGFEAGVVVRNYNLGVKVSW